MPAIETKAQLVAKLRESRAALEKVVGKADPEAMTRPGVCGEWSGKDVLAHLEHSEEEKSFVSPTSPNPKTAPGGTFHPPVG
jgi:hypothetical protein